MRYAREYRYRPREWVALALDDLAAASFMDAAGQKGLMSRSVLFHCSLCAEKLLKGVCAATGEDVLPNHNLKDSAKKIHYHYDISQKTRNAIDNLEQYTIEARYNAVLNPSLRIVEIALENMRIICRSMNSMLKRLDCESLEDIWCVKHPDVPKAIEYMLSGENPEKLAKMLSSKTSPEPKTRTF